MGRRGYPAYMSYTVLRLNGETIPLLAQGLKRKPVQQRPLSTMAVQLTCNHLISVRFG